MVVSVNEKMTEIANAIRAKTGKTAKLGLDDMPSAIRSIEGGGGGVDVSGVTATAPHVLEGDIFVDSTGAEVEGTMPNNEPSEVVLDKTKESFTIAEGYHDGTGVVKVKPGTLIVTPRKTDQTLTPTEGHLFGTVIVDPIPDKYQDVSGVTATAGSVLAGNVFVDEDGNMVEGTMPNNAPTEVILDTDETSFVIPEGYHDGTGMVSVETENVSVTSGPVAQTIYASEGKVIRRVNVRKIPDRYTDLSDVYINPTDVRGGVVFYDSAGEGVGKMPDYSGYGDWLLTRESTTHTIPRGYHDGNSEVAIVLESHKEIVPKMMDQLIQPADGKVLSTITVRSMPFTTAQVNAILQGTTFIDSNGEVAEGTMPNNGAITASVANGESFAIPVGYHNGNGIVTGLGGGGVDVSSVTATAPHVLIGDVFVDSTGTPVTGTMPNNGAVDQTLSTTYTSYSVPAGYTSGGTVRVLTETKSATPTKSAQTITPTSGKVLSSVSVSAIPAAYQDVTPVTATAPNVLAGDVFVNSSGTPVTGTMPKNGAVNIVLEKNQTYTIPKGYHPGTGVVSRASGGEVEFTITVTVESGATVTARKGSLSVSGTSANGVCVLTIPEAGSWTVTATKNGSDIDSKVIEVSPDYATTLVKPFVISYSGEMVYEDVDGYRYYTLLNSGVLTLSKPTSLDYWICGGGGKGGNGYYTSTTAYRAGGGGGGGGYVKSGRNTTDTQFTVVVGAASGASSIQSASGTVTANQGSSGSNASSRNGGAGGAGASGGGGGSGSSSTGTGGSGTGASTLPFGLTSFPCYPCAGGTGGYRGTTADANLGCVGGSNGSDGTTTKANTSAETGGGLAKTAASYFGSGGGGGCGDSNSNTSGGNGYQGMCMVRIPLSEFQPAPTSGDISFTVSIVDQQQTTIGTFGTCYAEKNMTWAQWVKSEYNTLGFGLQYYQAVDKDLLVKVSMFENLMWNLGYGSSYVFGSDTIIAGREYLALQTPTFA